MQNTDVKSFISLRSVCSQGPFFFPTTRLLLQRKVQEKVFLHNIASIYFQLFAILHDGKMT